MTNLIAIVVLSQLAPTGESPEEVAAYRAAAELSLSADPSHRASVTQYRNAAVRYYLRLALGKDASKVCRSSQPEPYSMLRMSRLLLDACGLTKRGVPAEAVMRKLARTDRDVGLDAVVAASRGALVDDADRLAKELNISYSGSRTRLYFRTMRQEPAAYGEQIAFLLKRVNLSPFQEGATLRLVETYQPEFVREVRRLAQASELADAAVALGAIVTLAAHADPAASEFTEGLGGFRQKWTRRYVAQRLAEGGHARKWRFENLLLEWTRSIPGVPL